MKIVTPSQMRWAEEETARSYGIPPLTLMENAGRETVVVLKKRLGSLKGRNVVIVAGPGHNGGDALAVARFLRKETSPAVVLASPVERLKGDTKIQFKRWKRLGRTIRGRPGLPPSLLEKAEVVVDGLFGTGLSGTVVGSSRVDLQACKLEYSIVSPK